MGYSILIVDDEPFIRDGIRAKLDCAALGIDVLEEAADGVEAIEKVESVNPDIVITDIRMPEMDGISLIAEVHRRKAQCRFAIISGYAEFEYAKQAIKLGVHDYILKPIDPGELERAIKSIIASIEEERRKTNDDLVIKAKYELNKIDEQDKVLNTLIFAKFTDDNEKLKTSDELSNLLNKKFFVVSVLQIKPFNQRKDDQSGVSQDLNMRAVIKSVFRKDDNVIFFKNHKKDNEFIFVLCHEGMQDANGYLKTTMEYIINTLNRHHSVTSAAGIGEEVNGAGYIWQSYYQASYAACEKIVKGYGRVYTFKEMREKGNTFALSEDKKRIIAMLLEEGKQIDAIEYIKRLFSEISKTNSMNYVSVRKLCEDIYTCIKDFLYKNIHNYDVVLVEKYDFNTEMLYFENIDQVREWIVNIALKAINSVVKKENLTGEDIVKEVTQYINNHYNESITLGMVSQKYHINQNYFCRLFKEVIGKNFNDYLTGIRIAKACELIEKTSLKINQISEFVGYVDSKYFSKVFKSATGLSPSDYLDKNRKSSKTQKIS